MTTTTSDARRNPDKCTACGGKGRIKARFPCDGPDGCTKCFGTGKVNPPRSDTQIADDALRFLEQLERTDWTEFSAARQDLARVIHDMRGLVSRLMRRDGE